MQLFRYKFHIEVGKMSDRVKTKQVSQNSHKMKNKLESSVLLINNKLNFKY